MKLKKMIFLTLMGLLLITMVACSDDNTGDDPTDDPVVDDLANNEEEPTDDVYDTNGFVHTFPLADMSDYGIDDDHRFYEVGMDEALALRYDEDFNGILYFGFPGCAWCRATVPHMYDVSQALNVDIFYVSRARDIREGVWLDWDAQMAWWLYDNGVPNMRWIDEAGALVDVGEEDGAYRPNINVPQVIHLRNGVIVDSHRGSFEGHDMVGEGDDRHLPEMTSEEIDTLVGVYHRIFAGPNQIEPCGIDDEVDEGCS